LPAAPRDRGCPRRGQRRPDTSSARREGSCRRNSSQKPKAHEGRLPQAGRSPGRPLQGVFGRLGKTEPVMSSCLWLERPGRWRTWAIAALLAAAASPAVPLLWQALKSGTLQSSVVADLTALKNSAAVALAVFAVSLVLGWPLGILASLYE